MKNSLNKIVRVGQLFITAIFLLISSLGGGYTQLALALATADQSTNNVSSSSESSDIVVVDDEPDAETGIQNESSTDEEQAETPPETETSPETESPEISLSEGENQTETEKSDKSPSRVQNLSMPNSDILNVKTVLPSPMQSLQNLAPYANQEVVDVWSGDSLCSTLKKSDGKTVRLGTDISIVNAIKDGSCELPAGNFTVDLNGYELRTLQPNSKNSYYIFKVVDAETNLNIINSQGTGGVIKSLEGSDSNPRGAVYFAPSSGTLNISNISFEKLTEDVIEAVGDENSQPVIEINNVTFSKNNGKTGNSTLALSNANTTIKNSSFESNKSGADNGMINVSGGTLNISNTSFSSNQATAYGGAIYANGTNLTISGGSFENNKLKNSNNTSGGAIYASGGSLNISGDTSFSNNQATTNGGAIYASGGSLYISGDTSFSNNQATTNGGAIYASNTKLTISNGTFEGNQLTDSADTAGGAIYITDNSNPTDISGTFTNNIGATNGGAIYFSGQSTSSSSINIQPSSIFSNNTASTNGGAIYSVDSNATVSGNFTSNTAADGGAIYFASERSPELALTLSGNNTSSFQKNHATKSGGAVYVGSADGYATTTKFNVALNNYNFSENQADSTTYTKGGAVYLFDKTGGNELTVQGCKFSQNVGKLTPIGSKNLYYGGSALAYAKSTANISNSDFSDNAAHQGGAINFTNSQTTISNSTFSKNKSYSSGGAIYANSAKFGDSTLEINNDQGAVSFTGNTAENNGGAIYANNLSDSSISNASFTNSQSIQRGGALYILNSQMTLDSNNISRNRVNLKVRSASGAGIYFGVTGAGKLDDEKYNLTMINNQVMYNIAAQEGVNSCTPAEYNRCGYGGGMVIDIDPSSSIMDTNNLVDIYIKSGKFIGNQAAGGGAIYYGTNWKSPADGLVFERTLITNNWAVRGGGIWLCPQAEVEMYSTDGSLITGNHATNNMQDFNPSGPAGTYSSSSSGDDIFYLGTTGENEGYEPSPNSRLEVTSRSWSGLPIDWYKDESGDRYIANGSRIYLPPNSPYLIGEDGLGTKELTALHSEFAYPEEEDEALVVISDNVASWNGGGIFSNNAMLFGKPEDVELTVKKKFINADTKEEYNPGDIELPESIQVELIRVSEDGTEDVIETPVEISADNNWSHDFTNLPSRFNGKKYSYKVHEIAPDYDEEYENNSESGTNNLCEYDVDNDKTTCEITITNPLPQPKDVSLSVKKKFIDETGKDYATDAPELPDEITVTLQQYNEEGPTEFTRTTTLSSDNGWSDTFDNLPSGELKGGTIHNFTYKIEEDDNEFFNGTTSSNPLDGDGSTCTYSVNDLEGGNNTCEIEITNKLPVPKKVQLTVNKSFLDDAGNRYDGDSTELYPEIEIQLQKFEQGGQQPVETENYTLTRDENWTHTFKDLESGKLVGGEIKDYIYKIIEVGRKYDSVTSSSNPGENVCEYDVNNGGDGDPTCTIDLTNILPKPKQVQLTVDKTFIDGLGGTYDKGDSALPPEIPIQALQLDSRGEQTGVSFDGVLRRSDGWTYTFENLPSGELVNGEIQDFSYQIVETNSELFESANSSSNGEGSDICSYPGVNDLAVDDAILPAFSASSISSASSVFSVSNGSSTNPSLNIPVTHHPAHQTPGLLNAQPTLDLLALGDTNCTIELINKLVPPENVQLRVDKQFINSETSAPLDKNDELLPDSIMVQLWQIDDSETATKYGAPVTLDRSNQWSADFTDLPSGEIIDGELHLFSYQITELDDSHLISTESTNPAGDDNSICTYDLPLAQTDCTITLTNSVTPPETPLFPATPIAPQIKPNTGYPTLLRTAAVSAKPARSIAPYVIVLCAAFVGSALALSSRRKR